ncbi:MAG: hypothetical protein Q8L29_02940 [archaeon]|nr:hypothetical protein [archaeon]
MNKRGQVWIETVLYTLIALVLIGVVLAFITPKINDARDRALVEQTATALNIFDEKVNAVLRAPGNRRELAFTLKRGEMFIDGETNVVKIIISDLKKPYSEPGAVISEGRVKILTEQLQKSNSVTLTLNYTGIADITYTGGNSVYKFSQASTPYVITIENKGSGSVLTEIPVVDINQIS